MFAQQNNIAVLSAEIAKQQVLIAQLLNRIEKQTPPAAVTVQNLQDDIKAQKIRLLAARDR